MLTTTLEKFNAFYNDETFWLEGSYWDDLDVTVGDTSYEDADIENLPPETPVIIRGGIVYHDADECGVGTQLITAFSNWALIENPLTGAEIDVLTRLVRHGPAAISDLPSKIGVGALFEREVVVQIIGPSGDNQWYAALPHGESMLRNALEAK